LESSWARWAIVKNLGIAERSFQLGKAAAEFFDVRTEIHFQSIDS
jgi:hypothetical protein